jgi:septal ring factor EnvC (AmiA/AmiB activator)
MDVERTIEFILETQAKTDARVESISKLMQQGVRMLVRSDARLAKLSERTELRFAELAETQKELAREQKELAREQKELAKAQKRTEASIAGLAEAQKATERSLKAFLDGFRHPPNGQNPRKN